MLFFIFIFFGFAFGFSWSHHIFFLSLSSLSLSLSHLTYFCNLICNTRTKNITRLICVRFVVAAAAAAGGGSGVGRRKGGGDVGTREATESSNNKCTLNCSASFGCCGVLAPNPSTTWGTCQHTSTNTNTDTFSHTHRRRHTHGRHRQGWHICFNHIK